MNANGNYKATYSASTENPGQFWLEAAAGIDCCLEGAVVIWAGVGVQVFGSREPQLGSQFLQLGLWFGSIEKLLWIG